MKAAGCLIQINAYSIAEERDVDIRSRALDLLKNKLVDFIGSDTHRLDHRPPKLKKGIEYLYGYFDSEYVDDILYNNAMKLLLNETEVEEESESNLWIDGMMGVITGDALGMPVGTWSDDGSMTLATLDSINQNKGIDYDDIMTSFR